MRAGSDVSGDFSMTDENQRYQEEFFRKNVALLKLLMRDVQVTAKDYALSFQRDSVTGRDVVDCLKYETRIFLQQENLEERLREILAAEEEEEEEEDDGDDENDDEEDEDEEESMDTTEAQQVASEILAEELTLDEPYESKRTSEQLQMLQRNVKQCVIAWDLWKPTDMYHKLLKQSVDSAEENVEDDNMSL